MNAPRKMQQACGHTCGGGNAHHTHILSTASKLTDGATAQRIHSRRRKRDGVCIEKMNAFMWLQSDALTLLSNGRRLCKCLRADCQQYFQTTRCMWGARRGTLLKRRVGCEKSACVRALMRWSVNDMHMFIGVQASRHLYICINHLNICFVSYKWISCHLVISVRCMLPRARAGLPLSFYSKSSYLFFELLLLLLVFHALVARYMLVERFICQQNCQQKEKKFLIVWTIEQQVMEKYYLQIY